MRVRLIEILLRSLVPDDTTAAPDRFGLESRRGRARDRSRPLALDGLPRGVEGGRRLRVRRRRRTASCSSTRSSRREDTARFWKALDRDVKRAKGRVHVLVTVFWHARSAAEMRERYDARIWAPKSGKAAIARRAGVVTDPFALGDQLPGGIEAYRTARAAEVVYWIPEHSALVPGDVLDRGRQGRREAVPCVLAPREDDAPRPRGVAPPAARPARAPHPASRTASPCVTGGGRALARALEALTGMLWLWIAARCRSRSSSSSSASDTTGSSACATRPTRAGPTSTSSSSGAPT